MIARIAADVLAGAAILVALVHAIGEVQLSVQAFRADGLLGGPTKSTMAAIALLLFCAALVRWWPW